MQTIWLEFQYEGGHPAANGSDITFYIDGRWSRATTIEKIEDRLAELRRQYPKYQHQLFVGIEFSQSARVVSMRDPNPPEWARKKADNAAN